MNKDETLEKDQQAEGADENVEQNDDQQVREESAENNELEQAVQEAADWKDKYLRLHAEFDNFRKRNSKERIELIQTAGSDVIREMLTVLDDFDRAISANESNEDINAVKEGFELIQKKMMNQLKSKGLKPMDAIGKEFNTDWHEAITQIPAPSKKMRGKVVDVVEKGYLLNDRVIRYAKVVVGQ